MLPARALRGPIVSKLLASGYKGRSSTGCLLWFCLLPSVP